MEQQDRSCLISLAETRLKTGRNEGKKKAIGKVWL